MSECGHEVMESYYTDELKMRIGNTWASIMRCQDGDRWDACSSPNHRSHPYVEIMDKFFPDKNIRILEVGAGDGSETRLLTDHGYKNITGITVGRENVRRGKDLYGVDLLYMDMHFMDFPNRSFDAVIGFQTYEHSPAPILLGLEFNRVLDVNGKIMMEVPTGINHFKPESNPHHLNVLEPWQAEGMFMRSGFSNIQVEKYTKEMMYIYGEKKSGGKHNNHFNDVVNGKFLKKEKD